MEPNQESVTSQPILIYIVDDEGFMGETIRLTLKMNRFRPKVFTNPKRALEALKCDSEKPMLLLTDFQMLPINGIELIQQSKQVIPSLKTILISGTVDESITQNYSVKPDSFLAKPFQISDLIAKVRSVLETSSESLDSQSCPAFSPYPRTVPS